MTKHHLFTADQLEDIKQQAVTMHENGVTAGLTCVILLPENIDQDGVVVLYDFIEEQFSELEFTYDTLDTSSTAARSLAGEYTSDEVGYILISEMDDGTVEIANIVFGCEYETTIKIKTAVTEETASALSEAKAKIVKGYVHGADSREHGEGSYSFEVDETPITFEMALKSFG